jgi:uncharacterized protein (DUF427 family)
MRPALEDILMGQVASPSFSNDLRFRWEDSRRRVRTIFGGVTIADSTHVMLLHEAGRLPVFYFPIEDVRMDMMEATEHSTHSPLNGYASYWTIRVDDRVAENAAWSYPNPVPGGPEIKSYMAFYWDKMDVWFEEDEQVFAHARDPYKRVDILPGSHHVRVVLGGEVVADTRYPRLLIETGIITRFYFPSRIFVWSC